MAGTIAMENAEERNIERLGAMGHVSNSPFDLAAYMILSLKELCPRLIDQVVEDDGEFEALLNHGELVKK